MLVRILIPLLAISFLFFSNALAASNFKIQPPATHVDGTPVYSDYIGYIIYCDSDKTGEPYAIKKNVGHLVPGADGIALSPLKDTLPSSSGLKKWWCVASAYYTVDPDMQTIQESEKSNEINFIAWDGADIISASPLAAPSFNFSR